MKQTLSRYQSRLWKYFRNTFLIVGTYFSGLIALEMAWPLMLWLSLEALLRYFPRWLQIAVLIFLGLQMDWWLQWPLGFGLALLCLVWLSLLIGRSFKQGDVFFLWQMVIFLIFVLVMMPVIPTLTWPLALFQIGLYSISLFMRIFVGKRV